MQSTVTIYISLWFFVVLYGLIKIISAIILQRYYVNLNSNSLLFKPLTFFMKSFLSQPESTIIKAIISPLAFLYTKIIYPSVGEFKWAGILPSVMQDYYFKEKK